MKLAFVFDQFMYGGIERVGITYMGLLLAAGHEVDAYILTDTTEGLAEEIPAGCRVFMHPYPNSVCPEGSWFLLDDNRGRLDVPLFAASYFARSFRRKFKGKKYAITDRHYDIAIAFSGHTRDLAFVADGRLNADRTMAWLHGAQYQYALSSAGNYREYKKIGNLVCLSELCDAECLKFNRKNGIRKRKIYNPCHITVLHPGDPLPPTADAEKIASLKAEYGDFCLMVARLANDKDQETVLRAMRSLRDRYGLRKKLLLVGDGPKHKALEELAGQLGIADDVVFTGTRADVQNYYLAAHAYVHAADLEGLPTVFLEAMACGLPIATDDAVPGAREILRGGEVGLITPVRDADGLADSLYRLYTDEPLRQSLVEKGYERLKDFQPETVLAKLQAYMKEITEK